MSVSKSMMKGTLKKYGKFFFSSQLGKVLGRPFLLWSKRNGQTKDGRSYIQKILGTIQELYNAHWDRRQFDYTNRDSKLFLGNHT